MLMPYKMVVPYHIKAEEGKRTKELEYPNFR